MGVHTASNSTDANRAKCRTKEAKATEKTGQADSSHQASTAPQAKPEAGARPKSHEAKWVCTPAPLSDNADAKSDNGKPMAG